MTLPPEQDAAVRTIVAEMLGRALNGSTERIRAARPSLPAAVRANLRDPWEAIVASVDDARAAGDFSMLTQQVRKLLAMRISEIEVRETALRLAMQSPEEGHLDRAASFYTFLTGRDADRPTEAV